MRYKKFYIIVLCLLFLLTGCVKGNVNIDFQNIDDVEMNVEILLPKSFYNSYATSIDELKNALKEKNLKDWQSEDLKKSINGVSYLGFNFIAPETINKLLLSFFYFNKQENNYHVEIDLSTINNIYNTSELKNISNYSLENLKVQATPPAEVTQATAVLPISWGMSITMGKLPLPIMSR